MCARAMPGWAGEGVHLCHTGARLKRTERRFDQRERLTWTAWCPGPGADLRAREGSEMRMVHAEHTRHKTRAGSTHREARALSSDRGGCLEGNNRMFKLRCLRLSWVQTAVNW